MFENASATINLNGNSGNNFKVERGFRQGYPIAMYLFLLIGEALTNMIKKAVADI